MGFILRPRLSLLDIDIDKDWRGHRIDNLGSPATPKQVCRWVDRVAPTDYLKDRFAKILHSVDFAEKTLDLPEWIWTAHPVYDGTYLYAGGEFGMFKIDPIQMKIVSTLDFPKEFYELVGLCTDGVYLYGVFYSGHLAKFDPENLAILKSSLPYDWTGYNLGFDGTYLYATYSPELGVGALLKVDPITLKEVTHITFGGEVFEICFSGDYLYVGSVSPELPARIYKIDPVNMSVVSSLDLVPSPPPSMVSSLCYDGHYLYAGTDTGVFKVDPAAMSVAQSREITNGVDYISSDGTYLYLASYYSILKIDPITFNVISEWSVGQRTVQVLSDGIYLYAVCYPPGVGRIIRRPVMRIRY